jgi:hypothetical protein
METNPSTGDRDDHAIRGTDLPVLPLPEGAAGHCLRMGPRSIRARARVLSLSLAAAVWTGLGEGGPAAAATAVHISEHYPDEFCGIPIDVHYELSGAVLSEGGTFLMAPGQESWVCTNPATGKRITLSDANPTRYRSTGNGDGTYRLSAEHDAIRTVLTAHGSRRLFIDAGRSVEIIVVDPARTEPVSYERLHIGARWDGGFRDLCAAAIAALT